MTTSTQTTCPECKQGPFTLMEGRFQRHSLNGDTCPMSGHEPLEWPLPATGTGGPVLATSPTLVAPDTKARAEAVAGLANSAITVPESALAGVRAMDMMMDTPPGKKRKTRSDAGQKRAKREAAGNNELDGVSEQGLDARPLPRPVTQPKAKRSPWLFIVAEDYASYPSEEAALAAIAVAMEAWEKRQNIDEDPPALIAGRVLRTEYEPARTIPAMVKVVR